jgi:hypothetical protein
VREVEGGAFEHGHDCRGGYNETDRARGCKDLTKHTRTSTYAGLSHAEEALCHSHVSRQGCYLFGGFPRPQTDFPMSPFLRGHRHFGRPIITSKAHLQVNLTHSSPPMPDHPLQLFTDPNCPNSTVGLWSSQLSPPSRIRWAREPSEIEAEQRGLPRVGPKGSQRPLIRQIGQATPQCSSTLVHATCLLVVR